MSCTCPPIQRPAGHKPMKKCQGLELTKVEKPRPLPTLAPKPKPQQPQPLPTKLKRSQDSSEPESPPWQWPQWCTTCCCVKSFFCGLDTLQNGSAIIAVCGILCIGSFLHIPLFRPCGGHDEGPGYEAYLLFIPYFVLSAASLLFLIPVIVGRFKILVIFFLIAIWPCQVVNTYFIILILYLGCYENWGVSVLSFIFYPLWYYFFFVVMCFMREVSWF